MPSRLKAVLFALFAATGFSALTLQVVWQRVISIHAGVDLFSFTTVVAAFLAGLGLGTLAGGVLADRLGPRRSLLAYAASNIGIAVFAWFSIWLFYDVYRSVATSLDNTVTLFLFHFLLLVVPTTLMGLSLPLVARGVVDKIEEAAPLVGRLYAVNTIGAGLGAAVSGWLLLGNVGFTTTVRIAGIINLAAGVLVFSLWRLSRRAVAAGSAAGRADPDRVAVPVESSQRSWPWFVVYGLTGAVALGLEVVFFRIVDGLMRSNSYTFGHVLTLYLLLFGAGAALGSRFVARAARPAQWFLRLQFSVGLAALAGVLILVEVPDLLGVEGPLRRHFAIDGYNVGEYKFSPPSELLRLLFVHVFGPLLVMGLPVLLMGATFPFVQAIVADRFDTLGRRTGLLLFANVVGNVVGTLVVGFVLIDALGTSGTLRLLAAALLVPGVAAALLARNGRRRLTLGAATVGVMALAVGLFPSNRELWVFFHSAQDKRFALSEDRACVNALRRDEDQEILFINATSQNGYPYDDFHVLIGLLPALVHPRPAQAMAVGLGIGATPYGMSLDSRVADLDVVELCGGEIDLLRGLAAKGSPENQQLFADDRIDLHVGDGRKYLLSADRPFDILTVDVVRPHSAFSGNLYSVDFYRLIRERLRPDGLLAQWIPSARSINSATEVFPYVMGFAVPSYGNSEFFLASPQPFEFDRKLIQQRFESTLAASASRYVLPAERLASIRQFLSTIEPVNIAWEGEVGPVVEGQVNRDLFPRDEYFLNNPFEVPRRSRSNG
ncbi:MAG: fused MFS/spermidine synthase [Acidimicrobiales bacterium]